MKARLATTTGRRGGRAANQTKAPRKATTYRLEPLFQRGLALLGGITKTPANRMVNEAVGEYLESRAAKVEADLEETLRRIKAYRRVDPNFEAEIGRFAEAEAALAGKDPAEGKAAPAAGPAQRLVRNLIDG